MPFFKETHLCALRLITAGGTSICTPLRTGSLRDGLNALREKSWAGSARLDRSFQARLIQSHALRRRSPSAADRSPVIMAGDFNARLSGPWFCGHCYRLGCGMPLNAAGLGYGYAWAFFASRLVHQRIDHILVE